eukprot:5723094-Amphidinium_carterae.1
MEVCSSHMLALSCSSTELTHSGEPRNTIRAGSANLATREHRTPVQSNVGKQTVLREVSANTQQQMPHSHKGPGDITLPQWLIARVQPDNIASSTPPLLTSAKH